MEESRLPLLFRAWSSSYEEVTGDAQVHRPDESYTFPLSRGREGFEFKADGRFIQRMIAPLCGFNHVQGTWEKGEEQNIIIIHLNDEKSYRYRIEIIELTQEILRTKFRGFENA